MFIEGTIILTTKRLVIFCKYGQMGASSRVRNYRVFSNLFCRTQNYNVLFVPLFSDNYLSRLYSRGRRSILSVVLSYARRVLSLRYAFRADVIIVEKELLPFVIGLDELFFLIFGRKIILDIDDAVFHNYDKTPFHWLYQSKFAHIFRHSALIHCGSRYLIAAARCYGARNIRFVPTSVDSERVDEQIHHASRDRVGARSIRLVWIGSPSTSHYLEEIRSPLEALSSAFDFELNVIGGRFSSSFFRVNLLDWAEGTELSLISDADIGLMPLIKGRFEKGKCAYKLVQYMACGVPFVATKFGENCYFSKFGAGILVDAPADWTSALRQLMTDNDLRRRMSVNGQAWHRRCYDTSVVRRTLIDTVGLIDANRHS